MPTNLVTGQADDNTLYIIKVIKITLKPTINLELLFSPMPMCIYGFKNLFNMTIFFYFHLLT